MPLIGNKTAILLLEIDASGPNNHRLTLPYTIEERISVMERKSRSLSPSPFEKRQTSSDRPEETGASQRRSSSLDVLRERFKECSLSTDRPSTPIDSQPKWSTTYEKNYYKNTATWPAESLTIQAVEKIPFQEGTRALDLGSGSGRDTTVLVDKGLHVTAVDCTPEAISYMEALKEKRGLTDAKLTIKQSTFADFPFEEKNYGVVIASYSLPFEPPETFNRTFSRMKNSMYEGGRFAGQLFGINHTWNKEGDEKRKWMTFHSEEEARALFSDMKLIYFKEVNENRPGGENIMRQWHYFDIIAQKL